MSLPPVVPAFVAAVLARDEVALRATFSPTFSGATNGRIIDAEGQVALIRSWWTGFPEATFTMEATGGHGRYVILWKIVGPHGGDHLGIPATGRPVEIAGFTTARSDETGIQEMNWKWNTKTFLRSVIGPEIEMPAPKPVPARHVMAPWQHEQRGPEARRRKAKPGGAPTARRGPASAPAPEGAEPGAEPTGEPNAPVEGQSAPSGKARRRRGRGRGARPADTQALSADPGSGATPDAPAQAAPSEQAPSAASEATDSQQP